MGVNVAFRTLGTLVLAALVAAVFAQDKPPIPPPGGPGKGGPQDPRKGGPGLAPCGKHAATFMCDECQRIMKEWEKKRREGGKAEGPKGEGKTEKKEAAKKMSAEEKKERREKAAADCRHRHDHRVSKPSPHDGEMKKYEEKKAERKEKREGEDNK